MFDEIEYTVDDPVATITLFGTAAVIVYPLIGHALGMSDNLFGHWVGAAVNDTSQVTATAFSYSVEAGETATIVKLTRNTLMVPVIFAVGLWFASREARHTDAEERRGAYSEELGQVTESLAETESRIGRVRKLQSDLAEAWEKVGDTTPDQEKAVIAAKAALDDSDERVAHLTERAPGWANVNAGEHATAVIQAAYRVTGNAEDAEDVLQETLLAMARTVKNFRGEATVSTWLYGIARNEVSTFRRSLRRAAALRTSDQSQRPSSVLSTWWRPVLVLVG